MIDIVQSDGVSPQALLCTLLSATWVCEFMAEPERELGFGPAEIYRDEVLGIGACGMVCKAKCGQLPCAAKLLKDIFFPESDLGICKSASFWVKSSTPTLSSILALLMILCHKGQFF